MNRSTPSARFAPAPPADITKHQSANEVLLAIRRVLAGEIYLSEKMTSSFLKRLAATEVEPGASPVDLSVT